MYDVIYLDDSKDYTDVKEGLIKALPTAIIKDASDEIHPYRLSCKVEDILDTDYAFILFDLGIPCLSFWFQIRMYEKPEWCKLTVESWENKQNCSDKTNLSDDKK